LGSSWEESKRQRSAFNDDEKDENQGAKPENSTNQMKNQQKPGDSTHEVGVSPREMKIDR
jgi:hypothetical protein